MDLPVASHKAPTDVPLCVKAPRSPGLVEFLEHGGQVIWFYKLGTDRDIQGRYPRGWREFDYLVSTATLRSLPDSLPEAREAQRRSRVVASFGRGSQRVGSARSRAPLCSHRGSPGG